MTAFKATCMAVVLLVVFVSSSRASVIVQGDIADRFVYVGGTGDATAGRLGTRNNGAPTNAIYVFRLPELSPIDGVFVQQSTFTFEVRTLHGGMSGYGIDLWGLNARSTSTVTENDYFIGSDDPAAFSIDQNIITATTAAIGKKSTSGDSGTELTRYINKQYESSNRWIFLRFSPNVTPVASGTTGVDLWFVGATSGIFTTLSNEGRWPTLSITQPEPTVVPEPGIATLSLACAWLLCGTRIRRVSRMARF